jgi:hypothetical protein
MGSRIYPENRYVPGTYKRECDRCGFDYLRSQMVEEEDTKLIVCKQCVDIKHPRSYPKRKYGERPFKKD